jgi:hypothetical protein
MGFETYDECGYCGASYSISRHCDRCTANHYMKPLVDLLDKIYAIEDMRITPEETQLRAILDEVKEQCKKFHDRQEHLEKVFIWRPR